MSLDVTVMCAVWHQQHDKESLLRGHMENLRRQTRAPRVIYVFDSGDPPPAWLEGTKITVSDPLTIYQAWNIALSAVMTPLVMNLNVDDRLAPDAIEIMSSAFEQDADVFLAGGDWNICFSAADCDSVRASYPLHDVPFHRDWPAVPGRATRLGSGDGARGTHGPASMWRLEAHRWMPRYPYRFADGTFIQVIADAIWWHAIEHLMGKKVVRLPLIIGNYRSAPSTQAEFRHSASEEHRKQDISLW